MSESEKIIVKTDTQHPDGLKVVLEAEDLYVSPTVKLTDKDGNSIVEFPLEYLPIMMSSGHGLISRYNSSNIALKKARGNPLGKYDFLVPVNGNNNQFIVEGTVEGEEGVPFLEWCPGNEADTRREIKAQETGWRVALYGASNVTVQFAKWDDAEGIDRIINALPDKKAMTTTLAFINPESTAKLTSRKAIVELKGSRQLPAVKMTAIRKMIIAHDLATKEGRWKDGTLTSLFIKVGEIRVPVAIRVDPSNHTTWAKKLTKEEEELDWNLRSPIQAKVDKENKEEWYRRFKVAFQAEMPGWRIVSVPNREYRIGSNTEPEGLWVTKVAPDIWDTIAPAAFASAKTEYFRGSRF